jgi:hypothetical protein
MNEAETYNHTQKASSCLLLYAFAVGCLAASCFLPLYALQIVFLATGLSMLVLAASFHHLTVADEGYQLAIRFGPLPLFGKRIWYEDIREVETGRSTFLDGWGIHWNPWHGWIWSLSGRDCVVIQRKRGTIRVGTDDPNGLVAFLKRRIAGQRPGRGER